VFVCRCLCQCVNVCVFVLYMCFMFVCRVWKYVCFVGVRVCICVSVYEN